MHKLRVLFLSDIHFRSHIDDSTLDSLADLLDAQKSDLLLLGGDYGEGEIACERFFSALSRVSCPLGKFGVAGNNDMKHINRLSGIMKLGGCTLLRNESVSVETGGGLFYLGGCDDHKYGTPETKHLFSEEGYRILLSHFPVLPECRCDLILSGHTHGGQIALGPLSPYTLDFESAFDIAEIRGLHRHGNTQILVGNGIGMSKLPIRIGCRSEIYLITFIQS